MNRCPNCAAQNREGAKFCTSCGFKLPVAPESSGAPLSDRSPFATTSSVPSSADRDISVRTGDAVQVDEDTTVQSFSTWDSVPVEGAVELPGPGPSWDAGPPKNTAVPVSDEMIESLVGERRAAPAEPAESWVDDTDDDKIGQEAVANEPPVIERPEPVRPVASFASSPSIDHLLKIARELEYGLIELAETMPAPGAVSDPIDESNLTAVLADLQSDDELQSLRGAIETARERPRDVDVMLDLVLRADAIASVLDERDRLKAAIEGHVGEASTEEDEPTDGDEPAADDEAVVDEEFVADDEISAEDADKTGDDVDLGDELDEPLESTSQSST